MSGKSTTAAALAQALSGGEVTRYFGKVSAGVAVRSLGALAGLVSKSVGERGGNLVSLLYVILLVAERPAFVALRSRTGVHIFEGRWERSVAFNWSVRRILGFWGWSSERLMPPADPTEITVFLTCPQPILRERAERRSRPLSILDRRIATGPAFSTVMEFELLRLAVGRSRATVELDSGELRTEAIVAATMDLLDRLSSDTPPGRRVSRPRCG